jgi:hypothetical protein
MLRAYLTHVTDGTQRRAVGITAEIQTDEPELQKTDDRGPSPAPRRKRQFVEPTALVRLKRIG